MKGTRFFSLALAYFCLVTGAGLSSSAQADCPAQFTNLGLNGDAFPGGTAPGWTSSVRIDYWLTVAVPTMGQAIAGPVTW